MTYCIYQKPLRGELSGFLSICQAEGNAAALLITSDMYSKKFTPLSLQEHTRE